MKLSYSAADQLTVVQDGLLVLYSGVGWHVSVVSDACPCVSVLITHLP